MQIQVVRVILQREIDPFARKIVSFYLKLRRNVMVKSISGEVDTCVIQRL